MYHQNKNDFIDRNIVSNIKTKLQVKYKLEFNNVYNKYYGFYQNNQKILKYTFSDEYFGTYFFKKFKKFNFKNKSISLLVSNSFLLESLLLIFDYHSHIKNDELITVLSVIKETQSTINTKILKDIIQSRGIDTKEFNFKDLLKYTTTKKSDYIFIDYNTIDNGTNQKNILALMNLMINFLNFKGTMCVCVHAITTKENFNSIMKLSKYFSKAKFNIGDFNHVLIIFNNFNGFDTELKTHENIHFSKFRDKTLKKQKQLLSDLQIIEHILESKNIELLNEINFNSLSNKILKYKKIGLHIVDWLDKVPLSYFYHKLNDLYINILPLKFKIIKSNKIKYKFSNQIKIKEKNRKKIEKMFYYKESIYEYSNINEKNKIRKLIEKEQKHLQNQLKEKYDIQFQNKIVSRAWCKLREMYIELNFFDNIKSKEINIFFMCEAPGMWAHSTIDYFTKHKTKNKLNWVAQSLQTNEGLPDTYSFMKSTSKNWDYGILGDGDITNYQNLEYYKAKYGEFDCILGDCGLAYSENKIDNKNLAVYQILYVINLLKKGGNFILKTFQINNNLLYLSLLEFISNKFDKMYVYRSSRNFWSPEQYIIGIGYNGIDSDKSKEFINMLKSYNENKPIYPIKKISSKFIKNYESYTYKLIDYYHKNVEFNYFLLNNPKMFQLFRSKLNSVIEKQSNYWINKYILYK